MEKETDSFIEALTRFVEQTLAQESDPIYSQKAIRIADARNHIFHLVEPAQTDEAEDTYTLADLCRLDEDSMQAVPNRAHAPHRPQLLEGIKTFPIAHLGTIQNLSRDDLGWKSIRVLLQW